MNFTVLVLILLAVANHSALASFNNGLYDIDYNSAPATSEVTSASMAPASAPAASPVLDSVPIPPSRTAPAAPVAAGSTTGYPTPTYSAPSSGSRVNGEATSNLRSCGSIRFIEGGKSRHNRDDCDTLETATSFVPVLMRQLPICIAEGVRASGVNKPIRQSKIYHAGSIRPGARPSRSASHHYAGRALDIWQIDVIFEDNSTLETKMHIDHRRRPFYNAFNSCWQRETVAAMRRISSNCARLLGMIDCRDNDHKDHVHVSLPYCPRRTGFNSY